MVVSFAFVKAYCYHWSWWLSIDDVQGLSWRSWLNPSIFSRGVFFASLRYDLHASAGFFFSSPAIMTLLMHSCLPMRTWVACSCTPPFSSKYPQSPRLLTWIIDWIFLIVFSLSVSVSLFFFYFPRSKLERRWKMLGGGGFSYQFTGKIHVHSILVRFSSEWDQRRWNGCSFDALEVCVQLAHGWMGILDADSISKSSVNSICNSSLKRETRHLFFSRVRKGVQCRVSCVNLWDSYSQIRLF